MTLAPIALFVFNRLDHTKQTIESLQKNHLANKSQLYIFSDAGRTEQEKSKVGEIRDYLKSLDGFKEITIIERSTNFGLAKSIITGVTDIINNYGKIIVLEDDLITSQYFLKFMNESLNFYNDNKKVWSISGFNFNDNFFEKPLDYNHDIYFHYRPMSWGWASWKRSWDKCDWEIKDYNLFIKNKDMIKEFNKGGADLSNMLKLQMNKKIDSWYIRFCYSAYKNKQLTMYPINSYISNIGFDGTGTHCHDNSKNKKYLNNLRISKKSHEILFKTSTEINNNLISSINKNYTSPILPIRAILKLLRILKRYL